MRKEHKEHWSRHPLLVSIISVGVFGIVIALLGSYLQHENWKKQEDISRQKTRQEKLFDKRAEIVRGIFYWHKLQEQICWDVVRERYYKRDHMPYWVKLQEIVAEQAALFEEIKIYFGAQEKEIIGNFAEMDKIWHDIGTKAGNCKLKTLNDFKSIEAYINARFKESEKYREAINDRLAELIYR